MQLQTATRPTVTTPERASAGSRAFPWVVFALICGLMMSDYMSRQVLSAVFPLLKAEWNLSDTQLASLTSVVALMVGVLALPLSLLADRWGRVRSIVAMAVLWSAATVLCAAAANYGQLLGARFLLGFGEAAYASVGMAVMLSVFAPRLHATLSGTFQASTFFGSVLGVALGGVLADRYGWRAAFLMMAVVGLLLVAAFRIVATPARLERHTPEQAATTTAGTRAPLSSLFTNTPLVCAYVGAALQLFVSGVLLAWLPSYFNRYHGMDTSTAGLTASVFVLLMGVGIVSCGITADRMSRLHPERKWTVAVVTAAIALVTLTAGFGVADGSAQMILIGIGAFFCAGSSGATTALVASLTHPSIRASAFGVGTLVNNILGMALGPLVVGLLSDRLGLLGVLQWVPLAYVLAIAVLLVGLRTYPAGLRKLAAL
ncbi:MFS transporter [Rhodococcus sp. Q]|uniref:MFS transporter n=1 Tax=Rhodococcus sp. Q TaxID=2502252 RepID=UPI0010FA40AC|nr:MFS transporter [Rhodococcus sp. Q]